MIFYFFYIAGDIFGRRKGQVSISHRFGYAQVERCLDARPFAGFRDAQSDVSVIDIPCYNPAL